MLGQKYNPEDPDNAQRSPQQSTFTQKPNVSLFHCFVVCLFVCLFVCLCYRNYNINQAVASCAGCGSPRRTATWCGATPAS
jgi:hypothetical protein